MFASFITKSQDGAQGGLLGVDAPEDTIVSFAQVLLAGKYIALSIVVQGGSVPSPLPNENIPNFAALLHSFVVVNGQGVDPPSAKPEWGEKYPSTVGVELEKEEEIWYVGGFP